ncbi:hypothetical protein [Paenibacillus lautus]|uniref:hypothetical protein n=1 Tax=Paenibacillus lautus TaxID=1401 RepID=UPI001C7CFF9B|nr:hypothetical protein [Paenibacillus lautus]MBX4152418.1 hypothetical protein [Paenibacillus lautus]
MHTNDHIAKLITNMMFENKSEDSQEFAVQLFIEHLLLPNDTDSWTWDEMNSLIKQKLSELDKIKGTILENSLKFSNLSRSN